MSKLILTVGLPRSGKTTWAKQQGHPIVSPDAIRLALHGQRFFGPAEPMVWALAHLMVASLFKAGHETVVIDACNVSVARRAEWDRTADTCDMHIVDTSPVTCLERALAEQDEAILPVIRRMSEQWDLPRPATWPYRPTGESA